MNELIKKLVEAYGPSGFESQMRDLIQPEIAPFSDDITVDAMGNLIAYKKGNGGGLKVMIAAHMDEIGLMVTHITEKGYLRVTNIGGINPQTLLGNRVQFANGTTGIVFSDRTPKRTIVHGLNKHYIDVGASGVDDCPVGVGDAAGFMRDFFVQGTRLTSKAMDDRIGCVVAIETLKQLDNSPHDVYFVFSVQEEVGVRGAQAAANRLNPDVGIALDVTLTGDMHNSIEMAVALGDGPAIKAKDSGMVAHVGLVNLMKQRARENDIPFQIEVLTGGSTDARAMQIAGPGCAAGCISIPCRYVHSQSETVDIRDVEGSIALLTAVLSGEIDL
ncbi:MAG: M42 family metallopeptidase [Ardenticatenaceae bacterium]|nr:M42 family metallopeptidase [Ardenticatenaceae bacterium]